MHMSFSCIVRHGVTSDRKVQRNKEKQTKSPVQLDLAGASHHTHCHLSCALPVNKEWVLLRTSSVLICGYFTFLVTLFHVNTLFLCNTEKVKLFFSHSVISELSETWISWIHSSKLRSPCEELPVLHLFFISFFLKTSQVALSNDLLCQ